MERARGTQVKEMIGSKKGTRRGRGRTDEDVGRPPGIELTLRAFALPVPSSEGEPASPLYGFRRQSKAGN